MADKTETSGTSLSKLERRLLALLEEPGGDYLSALVSSVVPREASSEIEATAAAIRRLFEAGMVQAAEVRDRRDIQRPWILLSAEEALSILLNVKNLLRWNEEEQMWKWQGQRPITRILLTAAGIEAAQQILAEDGWYYPER